MKDEQRLLYQNMCTSHFICKDSKSLRKVCVWEGAGDRTETAICWPPLLWPATLCLSRSPDAQPEAQRPTLLGDLLRLIINFSAPQLNRGAPSPFGLVWLSLPHLVYNSVRSLTGNRAVWLLSWLSYIIVQRTLSRLLDFWNRMLDHYQAEITAMQFTGHSLSVHQSMSVPWEFFTLSHFVSQFPPTRFPLITAIRMCHFLPVHHLGMAFLAGSKVKIQHLVLTSKKKIFLNMNVTVIQIIVGTFGTSLKNLENRLVLLEIHKRNSLMELQLL